MKIITDNAAYLQKYYFGILLKHYMFNQNSYVLKDMLIDTLYTQIAIFLPQVE